MVQISGAYQSCMDCSLICSCTKNMIVETRQEMAFIQMTSSAGYSMTHSCIHTLLHSKLLSLFP